MVVKKRGRPKGSKNKIVRKNKTALPIYTFTSDLCNCVIESAIMGSAMFCKHKNPLMARKV